MEVMCEERGAKLYATDMRFCIDNGAMIAQVEETVRSHPVGIRDSSGTTKVNFGTASYCFCVLVGLINLK